jgi:Fe2+ or Zn2+ uptake regulation protein
MDDQARDERIESLRRPCRERGLILTPRRRAILRAVLNLDDHPDTRRFGFVVSDFRVQLRGLCKECREQEDKR